MLHTLCLNRSDQPALTVPLPTPRESCGRGYSLRDVMGVRWWLFSRCTNGERRWNSFSAGAACFHTEPAPSGTFRGLEPDADCQLLVMMLLQSNTVWCIKAHLLPETQLSALLCFEDTRANQILSWIQVATILNHRYPCMFRICFMNGR